MKKITALMPTPDLLLLIARISVGFMFASGALKKVQSPAWFAQTFSQAGIPFPDYLSVATAWVELVAGIALILGLATRMCALALAAIMVGASIVEIIPALAAKYPDPLRFFSNYFYSSEWLLILLLLLAAVLGAGRFSLDRLIFKR